MKVTAPRITMIQIVIISSRREKPRCLLHAMGLFPVPGGEAVIARAPGIFQIVQSRISRNVPNLFAVVFNFRNWLKADQGTKGAMKDWPFGVCQGNLSHAAESA